MTPEEENGDIGFSSVVLKLLGPIVVQCYTHARLKLISISVLTSVLCSWRSINLRTFTVSLY